MRLAILDVTVIPQGMSCIAFVFSAESKEETDVLVEVLKCTHLNFGTSYLRAKVESQDFHHP